ncbi:MAG: PAS domain-containing sensor histidine kinase [Ignavibacteria bacterium]|nr:PAS domain-containing sensor histidine kinase [Ignavibacteria bacterium]
MESKFTASSSANLEKFCDFSGFYLFWSLSVPEQRFNFLSPQFEEVTGYKLSDVYLNPKLWLNLIQNQETKLIRRLNGDIFYFETNYSIKNRNGETYQVNETIYPVFDSHEQLIQLQGVAKIQRDDFETEGCIEIEDLPIPFFSIVRKSNDWKLESYTKQLLSLLHECSNKSVNKENLLNDFLKGIEEKLNEVELSNSLKFEYEINKDELCRILQIELFYQKNKSKEIIKGWASDITELKLNEKRLQKLNNDKNKLLSIVSHDLKAPFNTILNFINLINEGVKIDEEQKKVFLKYIYDTTKQQLDLIHDLLDWSKVEAGLLEFSPVFLNFNSILNKVISGFSGQIYQKGIQIVQDFDKNLKVFFDKNYLKIVLSNLISNAIKFSHKNGKIIISAEDEEDYTTIIIQDFGIGFSERYFNQLFQSKNFEVQIGTMGEKGTGFGLKFCYDIITTNYGKLFIESKSQKGTKVKLKLSKPNSIGIFFGDDQELKTIKNYTNSFQPNSFLYLCNDLFDLLRFAEENRVDVAFIDLDLIKNFQKSFIERVFSEFSEDCKIIGFTHNPDEIKMFSTFRINEIEGKNSLKAKVISVMKELIKKEQNEKSQI